MSSVRRGVFGIVLAALVLTLPAAPSRADASDPGRALGSLDSVSERAGRFAFYGWEWDADSSTDRITIEVDGQQTADTAPGLGIPRPDVAAAYPGAPPDTGFQAGGDASVGQVACAYALSSNGPRKDLLGCQTITASAPSSPVGSIDAIDLTSSYGTVLVRGWVADPDAPSAGPYGEVPVAIEVDGQVSTAYAARVPRPDVDAAVPFAGPDAGFEARVSTGAGPHHVCVFAYNDGPDGRNARIGCKDVDVPIQHARPPIGALDTVSETAGTYIVYGWMWDRDTSGIGPAVEIEVNGMRVDGDGGAIDRPDVAAAIPGAPLGTGFRVYLRTVAPGEVCVFARNAYSDRGALGCLPIPPATFAGSPSGTLDALDAGVGRVEIRGWAVDPDPDPPEPYQSPPTVHVYMDGQFLAPLVVDHARPDVAALVPNAGPNDGFEAALPARPGPHEVCVYAINRGRTGRNVTLGCRDLDVPAQSGDAPPRGSLDGLFGSPTGGTANYTLGVFGWAMTPSGGEARVRILAVGGFYANGEATYDVTGPTGVSRPDVPAEIPGAPPDTGYEILAGGGHFFHYRLACAVAQSIATGDESVLGCVTTARLGGGYF